MRSNESTVYVVDDDASFRTAVSRLLRASGLTVKVYSSATEFLARHDVDASGCVLSDLEMPEMNGLDLQSALALTGNPMPILFLTGHGDIPSTVRAMRDGAAERVARTLPHAQRTRA